MLGAMELRRLAIALALALALALASYFS